MTDTVVWHRSDNYDINC